MNRERLIEAATNAAKELVGLMIDEVEHELRESVGELERRLLDKVETVEDQQDPEDEATVLLPPETEEQEPVAVPKVRHEVLEPAITESEQPSRPRFQWHDVDDDDLPLIQQRCRIKAEGARWAGERRTLQEQGANHFIEIAPQDRELVERANTISECYLWMIRVATFQSVDVSAWETVATCFEALAEAVRVVQASLNHSEPNSDFFAKALQLMAEAQSALRVALEQNDAYDSDQQKAFHWLRKTASERRILIEPHMRLDEPADPSNAADLIERIHDIQEQIEDRRRQENQRRKLLNKLRYATDQVRQGQNLDQNWSTVLRTIEDLVADGLPPSNVEMREIVMPIYDAIPISDNVPQGLRLFIRETEQFLERLDGVPETADEYERWSDEVRVVAEMLAGKKILMIGGDSRSHVIDSYKRAFGVNDVIWVDTEKNHSYSDFEPFVARDDVPVVLLAIRWAKHSYGNVQKFCDDYGKPLIRLPGGYSPNQVAAQILEQASERL